MKISFHIDAFNTSFVSFDRCLERARDNDVHWIECGLIDGVSWIHGLGYQPGGDGMTRSAEHGHELSDRGEGGPRSQSAREWRSENGERIKIMKRLFIMWMLIGTLPAVAQIPDNPHPLRIGADQTGGSLFQGEVAAVRLYERALTGEELKALAGAPRDAKGAVPGMVGEWLNPVMPLVSERKLALPQGATIEAWIHPAAGTNGRVVDKITPGGIDGFLLDTYPGDALRLVVGNEIVTHALPHSDQWTHVAATIDATGLPAVRQRRARCR